MMNDSAPAPDSPTYEMDPSKIVTSVEAFTDPIEITTAGSSCSPDPDWSYTDPFGHTHSHERETWHWVYDGPETVYDADGEEHDGPGDYRCMVCGAVIEPGTVIDSGGYRRFVSGPVIYTHCSSPTGIPRLSTKSDSGSSGRTRMATDEALQPTLPRSCGGPPERWKWQLTGSCCRTTPRKHSQRYWSKAGR